MVNVMKKCSKQKIFSIKLPTTFTICEIIAKKPKCGFFQGGAGVSAQVDFKGLLRGGFEGVP